MPDQTFQCVDCGETFDDAERYRQHRADKHPRAETEDTLQGMTNTGGGSGMERPTGPRHEEGA